MKKRWPHPPVEHSVPITSGRRDCDVKIRRLNTIQSSLSHLPVKMRIESDQMHRFLKHFSLAPGAMALGVGLTAS